MKILFVCENYLPHYGGAEVVFKNLSERYVKIGHEVNLVTHQLKGTSKKETINEVKVHRIPSFFSRYIFTFSSIPKAIKLARKSDLIQTTTFNGAIPAWIASKISGKPVIITVHEVWIGKWKKVTGFSWLKSVIHNTLEKAIYLLPFNQYVCVSNATKNDLLKIGIKKDKVTTIHNGFDYEFWNPNNFSENEVEEFKKKHQLNDKFTYFSWGRPGASKGFEYLIKAVPKIKERIPNSKLILMFGSVDKYKKKYLELKSLIKQLNLEEGKDIKIIESVPYNKLGVIIKAVDCVVVPSLSEGFGYNAVEATSMDKPVVVSDAGSLPEVVSGKHLVFKSKDIDDLAEKVSLIAVGKYSNTPKKMYSWDEKVDQYLQIYTNLNKN